MDSEEQPLEKQVHPQKQTKYRAGNKGRKKNPMREYLMSRVQEANIVAQIIQTTMLLYHLSLNLISNWYALCYTPSIAFLL